MKMQLSLSIKSVILFMDLTKQFSLSFLIPSQQTKRTSILVFSAHLVRVFHFHEVKHTVTTSWQEVQSSLIFFIKKGKML